MNYYLVADTSNFKPFDMSLALLILNAYRDRYTKYEDVLNKIAEENGQYVLPDTPENKEYRDKLNSFNEDLYAVADDFSRGMNTRNAAAIMDIYRRSRREITPINKAIEAYNKGVDKINALGPDAIIGNKGDLSKISSYYGGANPIIDYRSGKQIELDSLKYFLGINNSLMQDAEFNSILGGQYFERVQEGIDSGTALMAALTNYNNRTNGRHSEAVQNLIDHMQHVMDSEGVEGFSEDAKKLVWNKIASGLVASIEAPKSTLQQDHSYESASIKASGKYHNAIAYDKELDNLLKLDESRLAFGWIPELDEHGNRVYKGGKPLYEYNPEKAKAALKARKSLQNENPVLWPNNVRSVINYKGIEYGVAPDTTKDVLNQSNKNHTFYYIDKNNLIKIVKSPSDLWNALLTIYQYLVDKANGKTPSTVISGKSKSTSNNKNEGSEWGQGTGIGVGQSSEAMN